MICKLYCYGGLSKMRYTANVSNSQTFACLCFFDISLEIKMLYQQKKGKTKSMSFHNFLLRLVKLGRQEAPE